MCPRCNLFIFIVILLMGFAAPAFALSSASDSLDDGFEALSLGQTKADKSSEALIIEMADTNEHILQEKILAEGRIANEVNFGALSQPTGACTSPARASSVDNGEVQKKELTALIAKENHDLQGKHLTVTAAQKSMYTGVTIESVSVAKLFPKSRTCNEEDLSAAQKMQALLIDPTPTLALPEGADPVASAEYNRLLLLKNAQLASVQQDFAERLAALAPTVSTTQWGDSTTAITGEPLPETISIQQAMDLFIEERQANPGWVDRNQEVFSPALIKEDLMMQAVLLKYNQNKMALLEKITNLIALNEAQKVQGSTKNTFDRAQNKARIRD